MPARHDLPRPKSISKDAENHTPSGIPEGVRSFQLTGNGGFLISHLRSDA